MDGRAFLHVLIYLESQKMLYKHIDYQATLFSICAALSTLHWLFWKLALVSVFLNVCIVRKKQWQNFPFPSGLLWDSGL